MAYRTFQTKADFDAAYNLSGEPDGHPGTREGVRLHYCRSVLFPLYQRRAQKLVQILNWTAPGPRAVIVGAGFGWLVEALEALGMTNIIGIDTSTWIQSSKATTEQAEVESAISSVGLDPNAGRGLELKQRHYDGGVRARCSRGVLNENASNNQSKSRIRQALGLSGNTQPDILLTESVLTSLTDAEVLQLSLRLRSWVFNVVHIVDTHDPNGNQNSEDYNWKTLEQWKLLLLNDFMIDAATYRVL